MIVWRTIATLDYAGLRSLEDSVTPACNHCTLCPHIMIGVGASGSHAALRRQAPFKSAHISGPL